MRETKMKKKKVAIVTTSFSRFPGDVVASFMIGLAYGYVAAGAEVFVLTPYDPLFKKTDLKKHPFKVIPYKYFIGERNHLMGYARDLSDDKRLKLRSWILAPFMFAFGIINLYFLVKKEKIGLINAHWIVTNGFIGAVVSKLTGVPLIVSLPGSDVYMGGKNRLFRWLTRVAAGQATKITSNSPQLLRDLSDIGADKKKYQVIIYGVNSQIFKPEPKKRELMKKFGLKKNELVIMGVGRLVAKKGFWYLIEAAKQVVNKAKTPLRFIIIGEGDQRQALEEQIEKYGLGEYFELPGAVSYAELKDYYNLADIFVLPSIRDEEGNLDDQSVSVVEAMSCAKPVVTTDFPGYRIVVADGETGYLVKEKSPKELAEAIVDLVLREDRRKKMGIKARERVVREFTWPAIARQYLSLV